MLLFFTMNNNRKKRWKHIWIWLVVVGYIYLIFRNSMMIAEVSDQLSGGITHKIMWFLEQRGIYAEYHVFHHYIRKLAHFTEFAGLGFLVGLAMHICPLLPSRFLNFALFLVAIPFSDEMLQQFFDGRSTQFTDMLIDGAGMLFGGLMIYILILIIKDLFHTHQS